MPNKTITIILGLLIVAGAGLAVASRRGPDTSEQASTAETSADTQETALTDPAENTPAETADETSAEQSPTEITSGDPKTAQNNIPATTSQSPASQPQSTLPSSSGQTATAPTASQSSAPVVSASAALAQLRGVWLAETELAIENSTGNILRQRSIADKGFYLSFDGALKCYDVRLSGGAPVCTGGYEGFTINAAGYITEETGIQTDRLVSGILQSDLPDPLAAKTVTLRQIYRKISSTPAVE